MLRGLTKFALGTILLIWFVVQVLLSSHLVYYPMSTRGRAPAAATYSGVLEAATQETSDPATKEHMLKNNNNNNNNNNAPEKDGRERLLQILKDSKVEVDDASLQKLPTWSQVEGLYGTGGPKIVGLETCQAYRDAVPSDSRLLGGAGLWNTGTNAFVYAILNNCKPIGPNNTVGFQVPWGKHMPASVRETGHSSPQQAWIKQEHVLPVVLVKDPLTWMQSMCQNPYRVGWFRKKNGGHCPNLVPATEEERAHAVPYASKDPNSNITETMKVTIKYPLSLNETPSTWPSLAHLWSDWNGEYYKVRNYPRLMIRYEDLLFRAPETVGKICGCIGSKIMRGGRYWYTTGAAKTPEHGHNTSSDLMSALIKYGNGQNRKKGMTTEDLALASEALDPKLMDQFQYSL